MWGLANTEQVDLNIPEPNPAETHPGPTQRLPETCSSISIQPDCCTTVSAYNKEGQKKNNKHHNCEQTPNPARQTKWSKVREPPNYKLCLGQKILLLLILGFNIIALGSAHPDHISDSSSSSGRGRRGSNSGGRTQHRRRICARSGAGSGGGSGAAVVMVLTDISIYRADAADADADARSTSAEAAVVLCLLRTSPTGWLPSVPAPLIWLQDRPTTIPMA